MNNFEIVIIALALVFSSWMSYLNAGVVLAGKTMLRKANYAGILFLVQFLMVGIGIWAGNKAGSDEARINMAISLSIMFIFGYKVLLEGIRVQADDKVINYTDLKSSFFAAIQEGITPLATGIAIGLLSVHPYIHWIVIGMFLLMGIVTALILAALRGTDSFKPRLGPFGGLLLLAAAIKLTISITGF